MEGGGDGGVHGALQPEEGVPDARSHSGQALYAGRTVTTTNAKLQRSTAEQNPAGLTTRVTDDAGGVIEHLYDAMGRLLQTFTEEEFERKRTRLVTSFEYDALGRKTKMTDPSMGTWEYGYTAFGELKWQRV